MLNRHQNIMWNKFLTQMLRQQLPALGRGLHLAAAHRAGLLPHPGPRRGQLQDGVVLHHLHLHHVLHHVLCTRYFIFIIFIMYCIMPVSLHWCLAMCLLSSVSHILTTLIKQPHGEYWAVNKPLPTGAFTFKNLILIRHQLWSLHWHSNITSMYLQCLSACLA